MEILDTLFSNGSTSNREQHEHAVIIYFQYWKEDLEPLYELALRLEDALSDKDVGVYDGHEIAMDNSHGFLYLYGPNAERLFKEVKGILESTDFLIGALANLRFGPPEDGVSEIEITIGAEE
jgi:hypothetical protein